MKVKKLKYRDTTGQIRTRSKFYAEFADHQGVMRRVPLFPDRKASDEAGRKIRPARGPEGRKRHAASGTDTVD